LKAAAAASPIEHPMLRRLLIRDFVIVDALELEFPAGFGALTGETGAGKSILVDALALVLGDRADAAVVRDGCDRAEVSAEFDIAPDGVLAQWLAAGDFGGEDGECLVRRVVERNGRSRAYLNGSPASAAQLREAGEMLADIHGQHAHHALLRSDAQRALLDEQGGLAAVARDVAERYRGWRRLGEARREAERNTANLSRERETVAWQLEELRQLAFDSRKWEETQIEHRRLANVASLSQGTAEALAQLDEDEGSVSAAIGRVATRLAMLGEYDAALREAGSLLEAAQVQVDEAVHLLRRNRERLDADPQRLAQVEARIEVVHGLARKHRVAAEALPELQAELERRSAELGELSDPAALAEQERQAEVSYREAAQALSRGRAAAAARLSRQVSETMQDLAMEGGLFEAALPALAEPSGHGLEGVEFRVAANPQQTLRPLAKVASGGELSRIGLAIQVVTSSAGSAGTLIFDEVDVGIGGRVAEIVGRMLKQLGASRQVLCVTHLPQVAARADWQWSVIKQDGEGRVLSRVRALDAAGRVEEIARMLGGVKVTVTTRQHAREMLGG
jgi:DNA repair protein RecN (Recombination protein N)